MINIPNGFHPIKNCGLKDGYYITKDGVVASTLKGSFDILSLRADKDGYLDVGLVKIDGRRSPLRVHRIMCLTFLENPNNYPVVNHIDGVKDNNQLSNLEWCTISHNTKHGYDVCGVICARQRVVRSENLKTKEVLEFESVDKANEYFGISEGMISRRVSGEVNNPTSRGKLANIYFEYIG